MKENEKYVNEFEIQLIKVIQTMQSSPESLPGNAYNGRCHPGKDSRGELVMTGKVMVQAGLE